MSKTWQDLGILIPPEEIRTKFKTLCPKCSSQRSKSDDPCLSIDTEKNGGCYNCHHCGWSGQLEWVDRSADYYERNKAYKLPDYDPLQYSLSEAAKRWFAGRGISEETLISNQIGSRRWLFSKAEGQKEAIAFPHIIKGEVVNVHYRKLEAKDFKLTSECEVCFYGLDSLFEEGQLQTNQLIICEGHLDKLSLYEAGYRFAISVPNGSPFEAEGKPPVQEPNLQFLNSPLVESIFQNVSKVILAGDDDHPGRRLVEELAKRIGFEKCWKVEYPEGCKDINDVLTKHGKEKVIEVIASARPFPVTGVITVADVKDRLEQLRRTGIEPGWSTGWKEFDEIYTVKPKYITIVTGVPTAGKTKFINHLLVNLARQQNIHCTLFSPESFPVENHISELAELYIGKPFGKPGETDRMSDDELLRGATWVDQHFSWLAPEETDIDSILALAKTQILRRDSKVLVLDPYNEITRSRTDKETDYVSELLKEIRVFARRNDVAVFLVAHPTKLSLNEEGEYPLCTAYSISGSAHFFNKVDFLLSIWRSLKNPHLPMQVHVQKAKVKQVAQSPAMRLFRFDYRLNSFEIWHGPIDGNTNIRAETFNELLDTEEEDCSESVALFNQRRIFGAPR